jgi:hypothetical protein
LPDPDPDFKKVNFIILIMLFDIFVRKYGCTSKITSPLHLVKIYTDPDPAKLCRGPDPNPQHDYEKKSLPLTVELLEGVIHGTPVSELHQPLNKLNNYHM